MNSSLMVNPAKGKDTNNCTIISLSLAACVPYKQAEEIGKKAGRKKNKGFFLDPLYEEARKKGIKIKKINFKEKTNLKKFISEYPLGRFVLEKNGHAFCVINGKIHDVLENRMNCIIRTAYRFDVDGTSQIKKYITSKFSY